MKTLLQVVLQLSVFLVMLKLMENKIIFDMNRMLKASGNFYSDFIKEIDREKNIESLLIIQRNFSIDPRIHEIYGIEIPKIITEPGQTVEYKKKFHSNILSVAIHDGHLDMEIMETLALTLENMRQSRIVMVMVNIDDKNASQKYTLKTCEKYKMTSVLVHFINSEKPLSGSYYMIKPYPLYHWQILKWRSVNKATYFPKHWRNLANTSIITMPDNSIYNGFVFHNDLGQWKLNGLAARLVMLFAERYNATLQFYMTIEKEYKNFIHLSELSTLTFEGLINVPMILRPGFNGSHWLQMSYPAIVGKWMLAIPCPRLMDIAEIYSIITSKVVLISILLSVLVFSMVHSIMEKLCGNKLNLINLLINDKILPGLLGQSCMVISNSWKAQKIMYMLLFLYGLNLSTSFSATLNTLITSAPQHKEIKTFDDLRSSQVKILFDSLDVKAMECPNPLELIQNNLVYTTNNTFYREHRDSLNTTYGYTLTTPMWTLIRQQQLYMDQEILCTSRDLILYNILLSAIPLERNSPFKEPLDHLIFQIHTAGLTNIWYSSMFLDLLKYEKISLDHKNHGKTYHALDVKDLYWIWMILIIDMFSTSSSHSSSLGHPY
ncbi:uncharacterized protein LOC142219821 [Haematobia irritans]|uniref:uncharacterized protein LOC142219821 n=1 Tax=Haematobia irritans TaxID=7368 RepID=UPI003F50BCDA